MTMGRTNPTFRDRVRRFEQDWQPYRRALRDPHQDDFDALIERCRRFSDAAGHQNPVHAEDAIFLSMLLAIAADHRRLEARVTALEDDA